MKVVPLCRVARHHEVDCLNIQVHASLRNDMAHRNYRNTKKHNSQLPTPTTEKNG